MSDILSTAQDDGFRAFPNDQEAIPTVIKYNHPGTQLAIALSDHRLRVYQQNEDTQKWSLLDQWRGHDAEIFDIQWVDCVHGQFLASIGGDNKYKLWQEVPSHARGRRFRAVFSQSSHDRVFYVAMDHLARNLDIRVGLVSQTGLLSLLEPSDPDLVTSWREVDALYPFGQMHRSVEPCLSLSFQSAITVGGKGNEVAVDTSSVVFAVSYRQHVKIYGSTETEDGDDLIMQEILALSLDASIIKSIAWANGTALLGNLIAVLSNDGAIRLIEVKYEKASPEPRKGSSSGGLGRGNTASNSRGAASGISSGLAGLSRTAGTEIPETRAEDKAFKASSAEVALLMDEHRNQMTGITWVQTGAVLVSMGRNGVAHMWKQSLDGKWMKYAESSFQ